MDHLGYVIILQVNGDWQRKLQELSGAYQLSPKALRQVSGYVAQRPLHPKSEIHPGHEEYGPERLDGRFILYYTNHHWFPVVWLVKATPKEPSEGMTLNAKMLEQFYVNGCAHYKLVERSGARTVEAVSKKCELVYGRLPAALSVIYGAPMPDNLRRETYLGNWSGR